MKFENIRGHFKKHQNEFHEFTINSIAGLFTGVAIGIFFELTTDTTFNRWINPASREIVPAIIYLIFVGLVLILFYVVGKILISTLINKEKVASFRLSYLSGTCTSIMSFLLVLYHENLTRTIFLGVIFILLWFVIAHQSIGKDKNVKTP